MSHSLYTCGHVYTVELKSSLNVYMASADGLCRRVTDHAAVLPRQRPIGVMKQGLQSQQDQQRKEFHEPGYGLTYIFSLSGTRHWTNLCKQSPVRIH